MEPVTRDPLTYFDEISLRESLVLSWDWQPQAARLRLVFDYAAEIVSAHFEALLNGKARDEPIDPRDLRMLVFEGVERLVVDGQPWKWGTDWGAHVRYVADRPVVIMDAAASMRDGHFHAHFCFIPDHTYEFKFSRLRETRRLGRGIRGPGDADWTYFDADTGQRFDFYRPFD